MPKWKKITISSAVLGAVALSLYCMMTGARLYPFDPFMMYAGWSGGKLAERTVYVVLKNHETRKLIVMGGDDEGRLNFLVRSFYLENPKDGYRRGSSVLQQVLTSCLQNHCNVETTAGPIAIDDVAGLRIVRTAYRQLNVETFGHPSVVKTSAEAYLPGYGLTYE